MKKIEIKNGVAKLAMSGVLFISPFAMTGCSEKTEESTNDKTEEKETKKIKYEIWKTNKDLGTNEIPSREELDGMGLDYLLLIDVYYNDMFSGKDVEFLLNDLLMEAKIGDSIIDEDFRYEITGYKIVPSKYIETAEGLQKVIAKNEKDYNDDIWTTVINIDNEKNLEDKLSKVNTPTEKSYTFNL